MKKIELAIVAAFVIGKSGFSQNDSLLIKQLSKPVSNCETVTLNAQEIISEISVNQPDSLYKIIQLWENQCGKIEPTERLKILLDIRQNQFVDTVYQRFIYEFIPKFKSRIVESKQKDYRQLFEYNKVYFDYLPLHSNFDNYTQKIAFDLLPKLQEGTSEYLLCLLLSGNVGEFEKKLNSKEYQNSYMYNTIYYELNEYYQNSGTFKFNTKFSIGAWFPSQELTETFKPAPQFGVFMGYPIHKTLHFEIGAYIRPLLVDKNFDLNIDNTTVSAHGKVSLTFGGWLYNEFQLSENIFLDVVGGFGLGRIDTDLKKPTLDSNGDQQYYGVSTYDASFGLNIRKRVFKTNSIGINASYHYSPFNNDNMLETQIGNQFFTISMLFRLFGN